MLENMIYFTVKSQMHDFTVGITVMYLSSYISGIFTFRQVKLGISSAKIESPE